MFKPFYKAVTKGRKAFKYISPNVLTLIKSPYIMPALAGYGLIHSIVKKTPIEDMIGNYVGGMWAGKLGGRYLPRTLKRAISIGYYAPNKPWSNNFNGVGGRSEMILRPDVDCFNGRYIKHMTIIYHDANKAGKHIDVHLGRRSLVYRVTGKPVEKLIKFNKDGYLTEVSKEALLDHLRAEIKNNSRVAQNIDHSLSNAKISWPYDETLASQTGYGSGPTRQIIAEQDIEFYHPNVHTSLHLYAPIINPKQGLYVYQLYPGDIKRAPILILGTLEPLPEKHYEDRLHLKLVQPKDFETKFIDKIDIATSTRKYDGASCYFSSNGQGFKFFSPRTSKETGKQIEYTYKIPELADKGSDNKPVGMGELLFIKRTPIGKIFKYLGYNGPEGLAWNYIPAASIGGILNANSIRPLDTTPELRIYRMDKWNGEDVHRLPFFVNRALQQELVDKLKGYWKTVAYEYPQRIEGTFKEGFVAVPYGLSIEDGLKVKWVSDAKDWIVTKNELSLSPKGNIQGVVWFKSLESDKEFKLGPGQLGTFDDNMILMDNGQDIIGRVAKVTSRLGHEGRAAKLLGWHMDKGVF